MNQPIDMSPPWWDGTIAIPFSKEEWEYILGFLLDDLSFNYGLFDRENRAMVANIIDRIQKNMGTE